MAALDTINFSPEQRRRAYRSLFVQLIFGWLGTDLVLYLLYRYQLAPMQMLESHQALTFTLQWQVYPLAILLLLVYTVITKRGLHVETGIYPLQTAASGQDKPLLVHNAVLRNSIEQWLIFFPLILICSSLLAGGQHCLDMRVIPILTITFVIGRLVYWVGYVYHPQYRVFGIAMTLHLSLYMLIFVLIYGTR